MKQIWLPAALVIALGVGAVVTPASAQSCPPGYYFSANGCYPQQAYAPPPVYYGPEVVAAPPVVLGGFGINLDFGGGGGYRGHGGHRGGGYRGHHR